MRAAPAISIDDALTDRNILGAALQRGQAGAETKASPITAPHIREGQADRKLCVNAQLEKQQIVEFEIARRDVGSVRHDAVLHVAS